MIVTHTHAINLLDKFIQVRQQTLTICQPLKAEDTVVQPVVDVSPPKWHMGHTTWFFEAFVLASFYPDYQVYHPRYAYLFNSYYEGAGERVNRSYRGNMTRPGVKEIREYRKYVDIHMQELLGEQDLLPEHALEVIELGLQHEQQHQELLLYDIKYILGHNPLFPEYMPMPDILNQLESAQLEERYLHIDADVYEIGFQGTGFHFDNEEGNHRVFLESARVMDRLITNGEFIEFIEDGGYTKFQYWFMEAWQWVKEQELDSPFHWFQIDGVWHQFTLYGLQKVDPTAPMIHASFYEADAFAKWRGKRLLTEFEWEVACKLHVPEIPEEANFVESGIYQPIPRQKGSYQFYGDVWEWTNSSYLPYPNFNVVEGPLGEYNGKFMVNQMVLRGGSCATPKDHIRMTYRNFFHPHLRWLFAGIRIAENV
ncbi:MAG: ergothioneine biosynthesis protein EgtB [Bacteroidota bacterium]